MQRLLAGWAQTAEQQKQLHEMVKTLVCENAGLREEISHLRNMVTHLTGERAETAQALRDLAA